MNSKLRELERKRRNLEVLRRLRAGDSLQSISMEASFFPPRPCIRKDWVAMRKLYEKNESNDVIA